MPSSSALAEIHQLLRTTEIAFQLFLGNHVIASTGSYPIVLAPPVQHHMNGMNGPKQPKKAASAQPCTSSIAAFPSFHSLTYVTLVIVGLLVCCCCWTPWVIYFLPIAALLLPSSSYHPSLPIYRARNGSPKGRQLALGSRGDPRLLCWPKEEEIFLTKRGPTSHRRRPRWERDKRQQCRHKYLIIPARMNLKICNVS